MISARPTSRPDNSMKKARVVVRERRVQKEYDFSRGVRGKYARLYSRDTNVVVLEPDVACAFSDSRSVNRAPRSLANGVARKRGRTS